MGTPLVEARGLKKHFPVSRGLLFSKVVGLVKAVDGIDFAIEPGGTLGLVGESGCGKTTTAKLVLLLEEKTEGDLLFEGADICRLTGTGMSRYRAAVHAVFQDPYSSLNPRMRVYSIIAEPVQINSVVPTREVKDRVAEALEWVGLPPGAMQLYPHEFSGGQRQRIAIARALALNPRLIVLDEPVSALDVSIQAQVMNLLRELQEKRGVTYLLIAHNLSTVRYMSSRVAVMYLGKIIEAAESAELYTHTLHPYTQALFAASLPSHPRQRRDIEPLSGEVPSPLNPPSGCRFHPRCGHVKPVCREDEPALVERAPDHRVACHLYG